MNNSRMIALLGLLVIAPFASTAQLILDRTETAGMSMFRAHWDKPLPVAENGKRLISDNVVTNRGGIAVWGGDAPGPLAFDALNRSLLIRFPDVAERIAERVAKGEVVDKVELVLPFLDEELFPPGSADAVISDGYDSRRNWNTAEIWRAVRPQWHAVAWRLRRPWKTDAKLGPTFNAAVNGTVFWSKYGAGDEKTDRFPQRFGPVEVSYKAPEGRLDLTASLADAAYGVTLADRLRSLADCGVLVMKEETYDHHYYTGCYEWQTHTGPRAILIKQPRLEVTFKPGQEKLGTLAPPADVSKLAPTGKPTAVMPTLAQLQALAKARAVKPPWMPDWQWQRVQELAKLGGASQVDEPFWNQFVPGYIIGRVGGPRNIEGVFGAWVDKHIGRPLRGWGGFESARAMSEWYLYGNTLPGPAQDAITRYWVAWLMPDRETAPADKRRDITYVDGPLVHPMVQDDRVGKGPPPDPLQGRFDYYWAKTGDWRGNKSFFRSGFCYDMSTQNFNTTASAGALLGGAMIGSEQAIADGRNGIDRWLMRQWAWPNGSGQEHIDHYYFAVTLSGNKAIADFAQSPVDRLLGQSLLAKQVEELISAWHPATRTFIATSSRTHMEYLLGTQDGLQFILHTLCQDGSAVRDMGRPARDMPMGMNPIGHELTPDVVARQTLSGPWAPAWVAPLVDHKTFPFYAVHTAGTNNYRKAYMGRHFGLASGELFDGRIQCMAQWTHAAATATQCEDYATLDLRCGINETRWANEGGGWISKPGATSAFQHRNRLLALTSPRTYPGGFDGGGFRDDVQSVQSSVAIFDYHSPRTWELWVDGTKIEQLPYTCKQDSRIAIKDGAAYVSIIPLPSDDCGRDAEVVIGEGKTQQMQLNGKPYGDPCRAALVIDSFWLKRAKPITHEDKPVWEQLKKATGGFAIELADAEDYRGDFARFQQRLAGAAVTLGFDEKTHLATATWTVGGSTMEAASDPLANAPNLSRRTVDGQDPSPPPNIHRDTPHCQEGFGHLEKLGAVLETDADHKGFLVVEPSAGIFCGWNPLPDLTNYRLTTPPMTITADGKVSMTRVTVRSADNSVEIDSAFKPGQEQEANVATSFRITGAKATPKVALNGRTAEPTRDGEAWVVALR